MTDNHLRTDEEGVLLERVLVANSRVSLLLPLHPLKLQLPQHARRPLRGLLLLAAR